MSDDEHKLIPGEPCSEEFLTPNERALYWAILNWLGQQSAEFGVAYILDELHARGFDIAQVEK